MHGPRLYQFPGHLKFRLLPLSSGKLGMFLVLVSSVDIPDSEVEVMVEPELVMLVEPVSEEHSE